MARERCKFSFNRPETMDLGVALLVDAHTMFKSGKYDKTTSIEKARRRDRNRKDMPENASLVEYLTKVIELLEKGETIPIENRRSPKTYVINSTIAKIKGMPEQIPMNLKQEEEKHEKTADREKEDKTEMTDQVKMMRFIAGQVDKLAQTMGNLNETLALINKAIRRE